MIKMYAAILILDDPHKCQFYGFTDKFNSARRKEVTLLFDPLKCHNSHSFVMCKIFFLCRIDVLSVYYARKCSIFISRIFSKVTSYPIGESETHMRQRTISFNSSIDQSKHKVTVTCHVSRVNN